MSLTNSPSLTKSELGRQVVAALRNTLPQNWKVSEPKPSRGSSYLSDLTLRASAPDGRRATLAVALKQVLDRRDVPRIVDQLGNLSEDSVPIVGARYLSKSVRDSLTTEGISYIDATGNIRIVSDSPAIFISSQGAERDPWRKGRPRGTLKGEPAARVTRALLDEARPWRVRELIEYSGASSGATYRVLEYLQREDLITKEGNFYRVTDWERLLRTWSSDAPFQASTRLAAFLEPRGVDFFLKKLVNKPGFPAAVTGSAAAREWAPYAPSKTAFVYVDSIEDAAKSWSLRPNDSAPNVVLLEPTALGDVPFRNVFRSSDGYPIVAPAQAAADLLNGPGREPSEGEFLIEWMKNNEEVWRRG